MANNFSNDSRCVTVWRFESGALTTDSKGTNTLTTYGSPAADATNYKEGAASVYLNGDSALYRNDSNLSSNFPFRSTDTVKKATICFWWRPAANVQYAKIFGKWDYVNNKRSFGIAPGDASNSGLIYWGYSGTNYQSFSLNKTLILNQWYHFAVVVDGINKILKVKLYDVATGKTFDYVFSPTNALWVGDAPLIIGAETGWYNKLNGCLDEMVVFNDLLQDWEIEAIRMGIFPNQPPGFVQVNATGLIVVYSKVLSVESTGGLDIAGAGEAEFRDAKLQITASGGLEANGQGESIFYDPTPRITATGGMEASGQGQVSFFTPGKLQVTASGGIEVTGSLLEKLFNPVRQIVASGGLTAGGAGEYSRTRAVPPADLHVTASGGLEVNGNGVFVPRLLGRQEVTAQGGMRIGGAGIAGIIRPEAPATRAVTAQGGVRVGGQGTIKLVKAEDVPSLIRAVTAQGGVQVAGGGQPSLRKPGRLEITAQGGVKVGQFRYPAGQLLQPGDTEPLSQAWSGRTALRIAGEGVVSFFTPSGLVVESAGARLVIGGTSAVGFISPPQLDIEATGGVVLDEGAEALDVFETWAFTGANFEPSIYSGFNFNSYCEYRGRYYGAGRDGVYLLEGEDDDGKEIHTGVRIGPVNFGTNVLKRIRAIHPGDCGDRTEARIAAETGKESYAGLEQGRLAGERFLGREFVVDIADFDRLGELEFTVLIQIQK